METRPLEYESPGVRRATRVRWMICALLLFATTINYLDRQVLALLSPGLTIEYGWTETQYGYIVLGFQLAYMVGLLVVGPILDRVGTRVGFGIAALLWSIASMGHAFAGPWKAFLLARITLGLTEAANFPAAIKATSEWFPKKERALATGIFNSGSNIGVIIAVSAMPFIVDHLGWRFAFLLTGLPGVLFCVVWLASYRKPEESKAVSAQELAHILSDPVDPPTKIGWLQLIPHRQTWAYALGKFLTDPVWWFFLFWLPKFFSSTYHMKLAGLALPLLIVYIAADIGSIGGGWISLVLAKRGYSLNAARKIALLLCASCAAPMIFASYIHNLWVTVAFVSLATAGHQGWSANLFTLVSDTFPRRAVASVAGFGGMFGAAGAAIAFLTVGPVLEALHSNYAPLLTVGGMMYLIAFTIIHLLVPRLEPVQLAEATEPIGFDVASSVHR